MSKRRRHNPLQTSLFADVPPPPRGPGHRVRVKRMWEERGRGLEESLADTARGLLVDRLDGKLSEFVGQCVDEYGLSQGRAYDLFQWVQITLFPEVFDVDLDVEHRKQGIIPRMGGDKQTAAHLAALVSALNRPAA